MSLKEQVYSVLFVSPRSGSTSAFPPSFRKAPCEPVVTVSSVSAAEQTLTQRSFDFILHQLSLPG